MLYLFDLDGTLIRSYMEDDAAVRDFDRVDPLPGRVELINDLREAGHDIAIVTNQGGMAFGYQTSEQTNRKLYRACTVFGFEPEEYQGGAPVYGLTTNPGVPPGMFRSSIYCALCHPDATAAEYMRQHESFPNWRKPGGGMIEQAMLDYNADILHTIYVGDMDTDRQAADSAGVRYVDAEAFFKGVSA